MTDAGAAARQRFAARLVALARARRTQIAVFLLALIAIDVVRTYSVRPYSLLEFFASGVATGAVATAGAVGGGSIAGTLVAEALALSGAVRVAAIVALAFAGTSLGIGAISLVYPGTLMPAIQAEVGLTPTAFLLRNLWYYTATALLLAAYFQVRDRELAATRQAQAAELERGGAQRAVMESRLKVLQARVEPELLFDVLADVQRLYACAPARAEALLDDLIVYLRAALPQMRGDASTLGREAALAEAFVKVTPAARDGALAFAPRLPAALADVPFPPMVLLPLVHAATDARPASMQLIVRQDAGPDPEYATVSVEVAVPPGSPVPGWSADRLDALRAIVASYYGEDTTLELSARADAAAARLAFVVPRSLVVAGK
jgi:hypothetical protein